MRFELFPTPEEVSALSAEIHQANIDAGWWTDLKTGESLKGKRNVGELLMLVVSEVCEGADGLDGDLADDKLPHRQMIEVELADTAIRIYDLGGGLSLDLGAAYRAAGEGGRHAQDFNLWNGADLKDPDLFYLVRVISRAMEGDRKGDRQKVAENLGMALYGVYRIGEILGLDVAGAIVEKRAFNKTRLDHQLEHRRQAGGKAY